MLEEYQDFQFHKMVSHVRLENRQNYQQQFCLSCVTGLYGCRWKRYRRSTDPTTWYEKVWLGVVITSFLFLFLWFYFWLIAQNDSDDLNWFIWEDLRFWFDWFTLLFVWCVIALVYTAVLLLLAISHCFIGQQLHLHWFHKALQVLILLGCITTAAMMGQLWGSEFHLLAISLQVTSPILQIVLVVVLTTLTWPFAGFWYKTDHPVMRGAMLASYGAVIVFFYLCPLLMDVPCIAERQDLPPRPQMMAHRGAEQIAPENTEVSFETAANNSVYGFESDVRISWDGVPFLMHDNTLDRTTNVAAVFPNKTGVRPELLTWEELRQLDAGSWFLQRDPFHTKASIPRETRDRFQDQKVLSLTELMKLAITYNKSVIFDLFGPPYLHPFSSNWTDQVVNTILSSGIREEQIWWLSSYVQQAPDFILTNEGREDIARLQVHNITNVNAEYSEVTDTDIHEYNEANITTNIYTINEVWLFSLYWCVGATSVTTSACHVLKNVGSPIWHMTKTAYLIAWVLVDVVSVICVALIFLLQRARHPHQVSNPEAISLNSPRQKVLHAGHHRKSDREVLYQSNDDTPAVTPSSEGNVGNMSIVMEDATNMAPLDHHEVIMDLE